MKIFRIIVLVLLTGTFRVNGSELSGYLSAPNLGRIDRTELSSGSTADMLAEVPVQSEQTIPREQGNQSESDNSKPKLKGSVKTLIQVGGGSLVSAGVSWFPSEVFSIDWMYGISYARYYDPERRENVTDLPLVLAFRTPFYINLLDSGLTVSLIPAMATIHSLKGPVGIAFGGGTGFGYQFGARLVVLEGLLYWGRFTGLQVRFGLVLKI